MSLSPNQTGALARYFADISKIIVASSVVGFFVPVGSDNITIPVFVGGFIAALCFLLFGVLLSR